MIPCLDERREAAQLEGCAKSTVYSEVADVLRAIHVGFLPVDSRSTDQLGPDSHAWQCVDQVRVP